MLAGSYTFSSEGQYLSGAEMKIIDIHTILYRMHKMFTYIELQAFLSIFILHVYYFLKTKLEKLKQMRS